MCVDYRGINTVTKRDATPLPRIDDLLDRLRTAEVITHLDLAAGYEQVRMRQPDIETTAFQGVTPSGAPCLLEYLVMPFGMCNAPATFTRLMHEVLGDLLHDCVLVYLDDIEIVYSETVTAGQYHPAVVLRPGVSDMTLRR